MPTAVPAVSPDERPVHVVAVLDSSAARHTALVTLAELHGWEMKRFDRPDRVITALDDGCVDLVLLSWADLQWCSDDVDHLLAGVEVPVVALADDDEGIKAALRRGVSLGLRASCDPEILLLSMTALLQIHPLPAALHRRAALGDLTVHIANHTIERLGRRQVLSPTEWQLFAFLLAHPERTFDRDQLARGAWGDGFGPRRAEIDLYVFRLRRKVERVPRRPLLIETVRNAGYRLATAPSPVNEL